MHGLSKCHLLQTRVLVIATKLAYQDGYQDKILCLNHHVVAS